MDAARGRKEGFGGGGEFPQIERGEDAAHHAPLRYREISGKEKETLPFNEKVNVAVEVKK